MSIYKYNYEFKEKTENEILNESINEYKNIIEKIINNNDNKESIYKINHINLLFKEFNNNNNIMKDEINFIEKEFKYLKKEDYIKNNLYNDLFLFSKKKQNF